MRVAIVHEWLETYAGSERVVEQLIACFPEADLFAVVDFLPPGQRGFLRGKPVRTSFIQRLPFARRSFRHYLALMPLAVEQFDLAPYDLVISSSHAVAKGVLTGPDQLHISYVHSPMRYAWDLQHQYLRQSGLDRGLRGLLARWLLHRLRRWDALSAGGVDVVIANSTYIARRIRKAWHRDAIVVPPPVAVDDFALATEKEDFFLIASRFVPYKRVDLIAAAFAAMPEHRLVIVGDGPERARVRAAAKGAANIEFRAPVPQPALARLMQQARAFLCAAEEDFGIAMVEAQACGTPVIAYGKGGARDIVAGPEAERPTGLFFAPQTAEAIVAAVRTFDIVSTRIAPQACRDNALRFAPAKFRAAIMAVVEAHMPAASSPIAVPTLPSLRAGSFPPPRTGEGRGGGSDAASAGKRHAS